MDWGWAAAEGLGWAAAAGLGLAAEEVASGSAVEEKEASAGSAGWASAERDWAAEPTLAVHAATAAQQRRPAAA